MSRVKNKWVVKKYHRNINDPRNRLKNEFSFLFFLKNNDFHQVAEPIAYESNNNLGLFSYLPGVLPELINSNLVNQACEFIRKINTFKDQTLANNISEASEACFSIISHLNCVKKRVDHLKQICLGNNTLKKDVLAFVQSSLVKSLHKISNDIIKSYSNDSLSETLPFELKIISPSDFGFQNTLKEGKTLYFLDFEYAGWDDPAKLICDFGCYPEIPIRDEHLQLFKNSFLSWLENSEKAIRRSEILMPLYRLKWCCIMLNVFTSTGRDRRNHAGEIVDYENQLQKSKTYFDQYLA